MTGEFITQRDFAAITGLSPSTVVNMIKNGKIKKNELGHIPKTEIFKVYLVRMQKYASYGTLIIAFDKSDEELELLKSNFLNSKYASGLQDTIRCYSGVRDIIGVVTKSDTSVSLKAVQERYNKTVLSLFMQKYTQMVNLYFSSLANEGRLDSFNSLTVADAFEYLMFGKFTNNNDAITSFLADSVVVSEISQYIQVRFNAIMNELCLVDKNDAPLFSRQMLSKDFFKREGELYKSFFYNAEGKLDPPFLKQNQKVLDALIKSANGKRTKSSIDSILTDGFVSIINVDSSCANLLQSSCTFVEGDVLSEACSGIYSKIIITKSATELASLVESGLGALPLLLDKTSSASVIYDEKLN